MAINYNHIKNLSKVLAGKIFNASNSNVENLTLFNELCKIYKGEFTSISNTLNDTSIQILSLIDYNSVRTELTIFNNSANHLEIYSDSSGTKMLFIVQSNSGITIPINCLESLYIKTNTASASYTAWEYRIIV